MRILSFSPRMSALAAVLGVFMGAIAMGGSAQAANPFELNFWLSGPRYDGRVGPCESALGTISRQFAQKEGKYWNSALRITGFENVREVAFRPWESPNSAYNAIPRRFCSANALLNDGHAHRVQYSIVEDGGWTGFGDGVEWCVVGVDRNWSYNPNCRSAKP